MARPSENRRKIPAPVGITKCPSGNIRRLCLRERHVALHFEVSEADELQQDQRVRWPSGLRRQVKVNLNDNFLVYFVGVGSNPTLITYIFAFFCYVFAGFVGVGGGRRPAGVSAGFCSCVDTMSPRILT